MQLCTHLCSLWMCSWLLMGTAGQHSPTFITFGVSEESLGACVSVLSCKQMAQTELVYDLVASMRSNITAI